MAGDQNKEVRVKEKSREIKMEHAVSEFVDRIYELFHTDELTIKNICKAARLAFVKQFGVRDTIEILKVDKE